MSAISISGCGGGVTVTSITAMVCINCTHQRAVEQGHLGRLKQGKHVVNGHSMVTITDLPWIFHIRVHNLCEHDYRLKENQLKQKKKEERKSCSLNFIGSNPRTQINPYFVLVAHNLSHPRFLYNTALVPP